MKKAIICMVILWLSLSIPVTVAYGSPQNRGVVTGDQVNLRTEPSLTAAVITTLDSGTPVTVLDVQGAWYHVSLKDQTGWVSKTYISQEPFLVNSRGPFVSRILAIIGYAKLFIGTRYKYGGDSPDGFDCSGFTMFVYSRYGFKLPHQAASQIKLGTEVSREQLIPGDLLFFKTLGSTRVNHVGIYLGEGQFIGASSGRGIVTIAPLNEGYYATRFCGARRLIDLPDTADPSGTGNETVTETVGA